MEVAGDDPGAVKFLTIAQYGLERDFEADLRSSREIGYEQWKKRPLWEKAVEWFGWLLMNQE